MPQTKPIVSIENVVASATVNQTVNLNLITQIFPDVEYHPDQFPGLVFRLRSPKTATLIFSSGKMVCTGAKSEKMAIQAVKNVVLKLKKGGIPLEHEPQIEIQNIVASASLGGKIHLELAARVLPRSMYEPEQFPGLILRGHQHESGHHRPPGACRRCGRKVFSSSGAATRCTTSTPSLKKRT